MDKFGVGDKVRVIHGTYTYTCPDSEGVVINIDVPRFNGDVCVSVKFYKFTGQIPTDEKDIWPIMMKNLELIEKYNDPVKEVNNFRGKGFKRMLRLEKNDA